MDHSGNGENFNVLCACACARTKSNPGRLKQSDRLLLAAMATEPLEPFTEGFSRAFKSIANDGGREGPEGIIGAAELRNLLHSFELYPSDDDLNELVRLPVYFILRRPSLRDLSTICLCDIASCMLHFYFLNTIAQHNYSVHQHNLRFPLTKYGFRFED